MNLQQPSGARPAREPHRIPREYLLGTRSQLGAELPDGPLIVFINSRSGGRAGARLMQVLCHVIGHVQARTFAHSHEAGSHTTREDCLRARGGKPGTLAASGESHAHCWCAGTEKL